MVRLLPCGFACSIWRRLRHYHGLLFIIGSIVLVVMSYVGLIDIGRTVSVIYDAVYSIRFCREKHNFVYLKVHKTGSSTLANIIQRFGLNRNLNFALPNKTQGEIRYNYIGKIGEGLADDRIKPSRPGAKDYNILYNHVIFNWKVFNDIFPRQRALYFTFLRQPLAQFTSSLLYFKTRKIYDTATENLTYYLENIQEFEPQNPYVSFTNNRQSLDLGLPASKVRDAGFIQRYIEILDKAFDLVLIMEYFEESLVMLRRRMCWEMKDILYMTRNKRYRNFQFDFGVYETNLLRNWSLADNLLYDHYYTKFYLNLKKDPDIMEESHYFKIALNKTEKFCGKRSKDSRIFIEQTPWNSAFYVTSLDCAYMNLSELDFLDLLLAGR